MGSGRGTPPGAISRRSVVFARGAAGGACERRIGNDEVECAPTIGRGGGACGAAARGACGSKERTAQGGRCHMV